MFVFLFLLDDRRTRIRIHTSDCWIRIRIQEAQKYTYGCDGSGFAFIFLPFLGAIEPVAGSVRPATSGGGLLPGGRGGRGPARPAARPPQDTGQHPQARGGQAQGSVNTGQGDSSVSSKILDPDPHPGRPKLSSKKGKR